MNDLIKRYLRLSLPFTILQELNQVRLVAGEDFRYTLRGQNLHTWLPNALALLDGKNSLETTLSKLALEHKEEFLAVVNRLYGERLLVDDLEESLRAKEVFGQTYKIKLLGKGAVKDALDLKLNLNADTNEQLLVLCQDTLDYKEILDFNSEALRGKHPWLWVSTGAMSRGFVSPVFFPKTSPCLACLITHFFRLSPMPEIYQELINHKENRRDFTSVNFPKEGIDLIVALVNWKVSLLTYKDFPPSLFRLHVLEIDSLEVISHRVFTDPECSACC